MKGGKMPAPVESRQRGAGPARGPDPPRVSIFGGIGAIEEVTEGRTHVAHPVRTGRDARLAPSMPRAFAGFFGEDASDEADPWCVNVEGAAPCPVPYCARGRFSVRRMRSVGCVGRLCEDCPDYRPRD